MSVKLNSTGGGSVTLDSPSTASNYTVTLPSAAGTVATASGTTFSNSSITAANSNTVEATSGPTSTQIAGNRNKIINGGMAIDQRNAGASQTITAAAALAYTVDRWYAYSTGANVTGQRVAGSTESSQYNYQFTGAASTTVIGFGQRIESFNSYDLAGNSATLSVFLANSLLTTVTWTAYYASTADSFGTLASPTVTSIASGTFTVTSTLTRYNTTISIPSAATTGIQIVFTVGAQTSGTWTIGQVQLEKGATATPFENRLYGTELALCQRYYEKSYDANVVPGTQYLLGNGLIAPSAALAASTAGNVGGGNSIPFKVTKRASPTMQVYDFDGTANAVRVQVTADAKRTGVTSVYNIQTSGAFQLISFDATSGTPIAQGSALVFSWTASVEL